MLGVRSVSTSVSTVHQHLHCRGAARCRPLLLAMRSQPGQSVLDDSPRSFVFIKHVRRTQRLPGT